MPIPAANVNGITVGNGYVDDAQRQIVRTANNVVYIAAASVYEYLLNLLPIRWRSWLTTRVFERYFRRRAFYRLGFDAKIDNPDQRIAEDVASFTQMSVVLSG